MEKALKYNSKEREAKIAEMDDLLKKFVHHIQYLREVDGYLKHIDKELDIIYDYYISDWLDDYNHFKSEKKYDVLLQDPIHNAMQEIHIEKIRILKRIVDKLS